MPKAVDAAERRRVDIALVHDQVELAADMAEDVIAEPGDSRRDGALCDSFGQRTGVARTDIGTASIEMRSQSRSPARAYRPMDRDQLASFVGDPERLTAPQDGAVVQEL